ncbi:MAG: outer membrane beta-barrel protein, partial [Acetobacteraceae bacterium]
GEATAQFESGPDFGRWRDFALVDASKSGGTGVLGGAHSAIATNWIGYGVNRMITPFAELGAESIHYRTATGLNINDAVWELGVVLTPNVDSQISIGYGHHQGFNAADVRGYYQVTQRTRVSVSYSTTLASDIQLIQSQLGLTNFDQFGNAVNADTGAPLFLGNGLLSTQNALFRSRVLSLSGTTVLDRDIISVSVQNQDQTPVGSAPGAAPGVATQGTSFSASWNHQISDRTTLAVGGTYSRTTFQTAGSVNERFLSASAGASYLLTETLSTVARYSFFDRSSNFAGRSFTDNLFLVGLTKRF